MRKLTTLLALGLFTLMLSVSAFAAPKKIVFAISTPLGTLMQQSGAEFTERLQKKLGADYDVQFFHSDQLGKDQDLMQKLKIGTVHLTLMASEMPTYVPEFAFWDMPFIIKDRNHLMKVEKEIFWPILAKAAEAKGYTMVALWENGFRQITNNIRPIVKPSDLNGIKLRTPRSVWRVEMFKTYGANPTPMAFGEVFVGLQTGVIDGQENPLNHIYASKMQEVQKYISISNHVYGPAFLMAFTKQFNKLPENVRKAIKETAEEVRPWVYEKASKSDNELVAKLEEAGMKSNKIEYDAFVKASAPVYEKFAKDIKQGKEMIDKTIKLAQ